MCTSFLLKCTCNTIFLLGNWNSAPSPKPLLPVQQQQQWTDRLTGGHLGQFIDNDIIFVQSHAFVVQLWPNKCLLSSGHELVPKPTAVDGEDETSEEDSRVQSKDDPCSSYSHQELGESIYSVQWCTLCSKYTVRTCILSTIVHEYMCIYIYMNMCSSNWHSLLLFLVHVFVLRVRQLSVVYYIHMYVYICVLNMFAIMNNSTNNSYDIIKDIIHDHVDTCMYMYMYTLACIKIVL